MDTSIAKALIMVAGVLLAMIVVAFMVHSFHTMGDWATTQDQELLTQQVQEFNREYEAYDKDLMYGVDVISCLNKAKSNNDKIEDERMINGEKQDASYQVEVVFRLKKALTESVQVYHMNHQGKQIEYLGSDKPNANKTSAMNTIFSLSNEYKTKIQGGSNRINFSNKLAPFPEGSTQISSGSYSLIENKAVVEALLTCSNEVKQTRKNKESHSSDVDSWTMAEWRTALYDLKTRKFTCKNIEYNATTGRINKIELEEM